MAIWLRSPAEIDRMRRAGALLAEILREGAERFTPGITTREVDALIQHRIRSAGAEPVMLNYRGQRSEAPPFPGAAAICINEEVVHCPPGPRIVREGDIATIDCALSLDGWCADAAVTVAVGETEPGRAKLASGAGRVLEEAIAAVGPGVWWSSIAATARRAAEAEGLWLLPDFSGHGIGSALHEPPCAAFELPQIGRTASGVRSPGGLDFLLRPGMTFTIEPVLVPGRTRVLGLDDGWTTVTADRSPAAHEERTIAVTRAGIQVLTR
jgi:methionyl aminopeptidase